MTRLPTGIQSTGNTTYIVPPTVLKAEGLVKVYGKRRVVDGVSFHVNRGEVVGLLGPNGAGKTTSFRMTCGLIDANEGIVFLNGKDVTGWPLYRRAREGGMGYLPQLASVFQQLNVQDNLLGMMEMLGMNSRTRREKCNTLLEKMKLTHLRKNLAKGLSGGERRRLEIARALVSDPKIILLDEPFAAIDPITVQNLQAIIRQLIKDGISILITDHGVTETLEITDRSYIIEAGKVLCAGTPQEVLANEAAKNAYFGNLADSAAGPAKTGAAKPGATVGTSHTPGGGKPKPSRRFDDSDDDLLHGATSATTGATSATTGVPSATAGAKRPSRPARPDMARSNASRDNDDADYDVYEDYTPSRRRPSVTVRSPNAGGHQRDDQVRREDQQAADKQATGKSRTPADNDKPVPRVSLIGRLSGVFKKPTDDKQQPGT